MDPNVLRQLKMKGDDHMPNNNRIVVPEARRAMENLKFETAQEMGIPNYEAVDKGALPSRVNGAVGGHMVRKLIRYAEESLANTPDQPQ